MNHIPVLGTFFGLALLAFAAWKRSDELRKAAFGTFVIAALAGVATYLTGEPAEDGVKGLPGISTALIEHHEEAAGIALGGAIALGVLALGGLIWFRGGPADQERVQHIGASGSNPRHWLNGVDSEPRRPNPPLGDPLGRGTHDHQFWRAPIAGEAIIRQRIRQPLKRAGW